MIGKYFLKKNISMLEDWLDIFMINPEIQQRKCNCNNNIWFNSLILIQN